jgi:hypothetical protein
MIYGRQFSGVFAFVRVLSVFFDQSPRLHPQR